MTMWWKELAKWLMNKFIKSSWFKYFRAFLKPCMSENRTSEVHRSQRPSVPQSTNFFWNLVTGSNINVLFLGPRINTYPEESYFLIFLQHKRKDAFFHITPTLEHIHREDVAGNETSNFDLAQATITFWHSVFYIIKKLNTKIWEILLRPTCRDLIPRSNKQTNIEIHSCPDSRF